MSKKPPFKPTPRPRLIGVAVFPGFQILDAAGPIAAFEIAAHFSAGAYRVRLLASAAGSIVSSAGVSMPAAALRGEIDTLIVVGGEGTTRAMADARLLSALKRYATSARRIASVCSGAFVLAAAGLLDGKRATTHWRKAALLARLFPNVRVEPNCIHTHDGKVWTSAGVTAGIDLALAMIAEDIGHEIATHVAREMVVHVTRAGGQSQHSAMLDLDTPRFSGLNAWVRDHLSEDLSVDGLARRAGMSPRNFARTYTAETGVTPAKAVERMRAEAARMLLERHHSIDTIARETGFGDSERMRRAFLRLYGAPPAALRRTIRPA